MGVGSGRVNKNSYNGSLGNDRVLPLILPHSRLIKENRMWYQYYTEYCPVCGKSHTTKEAVRDRPKPEEWDDRHETKEVFDYCNV